MSQPEFFIPDPEKCFEAREAVVATWGHVSTWVIRTINNEPTPPLHTQVKAVAYPHVLTAKDFIDSLLPNVAQGEATATMADAIDVYKVLQTIYCSDLAEISEQHGVDPASLMITTDLRKELTPEEAALERPRAPVIGAMATYYAAKVEEHISNLFQQTMQS